MSPQGPAADQLCCCPISQSWEAKHGLACNHVGNLCKIEMDELCNRALLVAK